MLMSATYRSYAGHPEPKRSNRSPGSTYQRSSLRDKVNDVARHVERLGEEVRFLQNRLFALELWLATHTDYDPSKLPASKAGLNWLRCPT